MASFDDLGEIYVGEELRAFMEALNITQKDLAEVLGVSQPKVWKILNNETPVKRLDVVKITDKYKKSIIFEKYEEVSRQYFNQQLLFGSV
jgi:transcriptional regulator with XRE-family HTH domain